MFRHCGNLSYDDFLRLFLLPRVWRPVVVVLDDSGCLGGGSDAIDSESSLCSASVSCIPDRVDLASLGRFGGLGW